MEWVIGIQKAIDYIEDHITEELDYEEIAKAGLSSSFHFQRVFSILCGYTLGEYIRSRRLALAGAELAEKKLKVIDAAVKYGYDNPDSFTRAFTKFHGITPSAAREPGAALRSFAPLAIKISLEEDCSAGDKSRLGCRIEEKPEMVFTGYKKSFTGTLAERFEQEGDFYFTTRANQYLLWGLSRDAQTSYGIMKNFRENDYDFYIASLLTEWNRSHLQEILGNAEDAERFENIVIPAQSYVVCETERVKHPTMIYMDLRKRIVEEWLPSSGYLLTDAPEITVTHWYEKPADTKRYIELWLPVEKDHFPA